MSIILGLWFHNVYAFFFGSYYNWSHHMLFSSNGPLIETYLEYQTFYVSYNMETVVSTR